MGPKYDPAKGEGIMAFVGRYQEFQANQEITHDLIKVQLWLGYLLLIGGSPIPRISSCMLKALNRTSVKRTTVYAKRSAIPV